MKIYEQTIENENGSKVLRVGFYEHKACIHTFDIPLNFDRCAALRTAKAKEKGIEEFLASFEGKKFTEKEVLKAYSLVDDYFMAKYKELYPHGGWRNGGRKKGVKMNPENKSPRTEYLLKRITKTEKQFLTDCLENFRNNPENPLVAEWLNRYGIEK